tara:strand:- start:15507 stop:15905 length:399 start_codon:yes stop_codon:yes gene_type:complete
MPTTKKVWVNGTFDVIHRGHLELFKFAKSKGDHLIVGIDSDERIKKNKGISRPINTLENRYFFLKCIKYVDEVRTFGSDEELNNIITSYRPDYIVVGSDWRDKEVIGSKFAKDILFFERIEGLSTSNILEKI